MRVLLVASSGGHLAHLLWLEPWWRQHARAWVTFDTVDARSRLGGETVYHAAHPTNRSARNALRNWRIARDVLAWERPDVVVSSGAGVAVPFLLAAKWHGIPTVFLEVLDRIDHPSLTARALGPFVDGLALQWPEQRQALGRGTVLGPILGLGEQL